MKIKVAINKCHGGFGISQKAYLRMKELGSEWALKGSKWDFSSYNSINPDVDRFDPILIQVIEELGKEANGQNSDIRIEEYYLSANIHDYDGKETFEGFDGFSK